LFEVIMGISVFAASLLLLLQTSKGSIEGFVVSSTTNKPVAGAQVTSLKLPDRVPGATGGIIVGQVGGGPPDRPMTTTDASGHFVFSNIDAGTYQISATAEGYAQQQFGPSPNGQNGMTASVTVAAGQAANNIVLHLTPGGTISGRVTGGNGEPLVGMDVQLVRATYQIDGRRNLSQLGTAQTNDRGEYRLFWMPPGKYYLSVSASIRPAPGTFGPPSNVNNKYPRTYYPGSSDVSGATEIDVPAGGELNGIDLRLAPQATYRIRGRVVDSATGQFPQNASVMIIPRDQVVGGISTLGSQYNRNNGTFEIRDVLAGAYWIRAQMPMSGPPQTGTRFMPPPTGVAAVDVTANDVEGVSVVIQPPFSIPGRVRIDGEASLANLPQIRISLQPPTNSFIAFRLPTPPVISPDGTFAFEDVGPGEYQLNVPILGGPNAPAVFVKEARLGGADVLNQPIVISGPVSDQFDIVLGTTTVQITGTVTDDRQQPASRAQVLFIPDRRDRRDLFRNAVTNASGQFTMRNVPPGSYTVFAADPQDGSIFDPAVMAKLEQKGQRVTVTNSSNITLSLKLLSPSR
jgi:protocatechuate 3,4-dioxygenase beta subunit